MLKCIARVVGRAFLQDRESPIAFVEVARNASLIPVELWGREERERLLPLLDGKWLLKYSFQFWKCGSRNPKLSYVRRFGVRAGNCEMRDSLVT